jgi:Cof subfamily protein (haloacid dehalogenase superfamily)
MYKCVFSDLDRTLLNTEGKMSAYTVETINRLFELGIEFIPSSGRAFNSLPDQLSVLNVLNYAVTSNGVCVNDFKKRQSISSSCVPSQTIEALLKFIKDRNIYIECFVEGQGYTAKSYYENPVTKGGRISYMVEYVRATRKPVDDIWKFAFDYKDKMEAFDIICDASVVFDFEKELKEKFTDVYITHSENYLIEISNVESGKHNGMKKACDILGIDLKDCIAFGDADNDKEMLKEAGLGIAVSNASDACKNSADKISLWTNNQDAVAKELREIFKF